MASAAARRALAAYTAAVVLIRARVDEAVERAWNGLDEYRDPDADRFAAALVPLVLGAQRQVAAQTDAYLAQVERASTGLTVAPLGIPADVLAYDALRGAEAAEVYRRPFVTVWNALSEGDTFTAAAAKGLDRARATAATDVQLAKTHAARHVLTTKDNVVGYRRVPESGACDLCKNAARNTYRSGDLLPIHARCDCGVEPIFGTRSTGRRLDGDDVIEVHHHDELGPVLTAAGHAFSGPPRA